MSSTLVTGHGLGRRRPGGGWLLRDVTVELRPGERIALTGPSGSGKSLLLRALALLDPLDRGNVTWHAEGIPDAKVPRYRSRVVYLHQTPQLGGPTVGSVLERVFTLRLHRHRTFDRDWIVERLERLGRGSDFLDRQVRVLSGGEAQIVALLRVVQLAPEALLLDEPTSAVDPEAARAIEELVEDWYEAGAGERALIWVGHDRRQASRMTDRMLSIRQGILLGEEPR